MKHVLITILFLSPGLLAGTPVDSSKNKEVRRLRDSSVSLWNKGNYNEALAVANQAKEHAESIKDSFQVAICLNNIGLIYSSKGDPATSIFFCEQALSVFRAIKNNKELATTLLNLGIAYKEQAIYDKAFSYLFESVTYFEKVGDIKGLSSAYNTIGNIFKNEKDYGKSLQYHFNALALREKINYEEGIAGSYNNIGIVYKESGKPDSALFYLHASLKLKRRQAKPEQLANTLSQIGEIVMMKGDYKLAGTYYDESYGIRKEMGNKTGVARSLYELGTLNLKVGNLNKARLFLHESESRAIELKISDLLLKCYNMLKKVYENQGQYTKALSYADKYILLNDVVLGEEKQKSLTQMEVKYDMQKKQHEIQDLNQDREKKEALILARDLQLQAKDAFAKNLFIVLVLLALVVILLLLLFRNRLLFARKLDNTMRELHHRVMNNFQVLLSLSDLQLRQIIDKQARRIAISNTNRIAAMMFIHRDLYVAPDITKVNMYTYIHTLANNLMAVYELGSDDIDIAYSVRENIQIDVHKAFALGLIINELITNALKHAFHPDHTHPRLEILFEKNDAETYRLIIKDNGAGLHKDEDRKSLGLKLVEGQVKSLRGDMKVSDNNGLMYEISFK